MLHLVHGIYKSSLHPCYWRGDGEGELSQSGVEKLVVPSIISSTERKGFRWRSCGVFWGCLRSCPLTNFSR